MEQHNPGNSEITPLKKSSKIYFFIIALATLLATNIYYVVEYKSLGKKVEFLSSEKHQLQTEVDRIEAELDKIIQNNPSISNALMDNQTEARAQIANLRYRLSTGEVTDREIKVARFEVQNLRYLVDDYTTNIENLKSENAKLSSEKKTLEETVHSTNKKVNKLTGENEVLIGKVETASGLKLSGISINAIQLRSRDREKVETRAKRIDVLRIDFDIVENSLAKKGTHEVFLRIMDPNGNLLSDGKSTFSANGRNMQYTFKTSINFSNDGKKYSIDWKPEEESSFQKGIYTVVLYADNFTMGRGEVALK